MTTHLQHRACDLLVPHPEGGAVVGRGGRDRSRPLRRSRAFVGSMAFVVVIPSDPAALREHARSLLAHAPESRT